MILNIDEFDLIISHPKEVNNASPYIESFPQTFLPML
jgi:hypothetical protein